MLFLIEVVVVITVAIFISRYTKQSRNPWVRNIPFYFVCFLAGLEILGILYRMIHALSTKYGLFSEAFATVLEVSLKLVGYLFGGSCIIALIIISCGLGFAIFWQITTGEKIFEGRLKREE
jgi:hypothetical protein